MKEAVHIGRNPSARPDLQQLIHEVALGDQDSFAAVYDAVAGTVLGVVRAVLRDRAQSEEVAQAVLVEVWRTAPRYRPERGTVINWILTLAHRRAADRVRSVEAAARDHQAALLDRTPEYDEVTERVETRPERSRCGAACVPSPRSSASPSPSPTTAACLPAGRRVARAAARHGEDAAARWSHPAP